MTGKSALKQLHNTRKYTDGGTVPTQKSKTSQLKTDIGNLALNTLAILDGISLAPIKRYTNELFMSGPKAASEYIRNHYKDLGSNYKTILEEGPLYPNSKLKELDFNTMPEKIQDKSSLMGTYGYIEGLFFDPLLYISGAGAGKAVPSMTAKVGPKVARRAVGQGTRQAVGRGAATAREALSTLAKPTAQQRWAKSFKDGLKWGIPISGAAGGIDYYNRVQQKKWDMRQPFSPEDYYVDEDGYYRDQDGNYFVDENNEYWRSDEFENGSNQLNNNSQILENYLDWYQQ